MCYGSVAAMQDNIHTMQGEAVTMHFQYSHSFSPTSAPYFVVFLPLLWTLSSCVVRTLWFLTWATEGVYSEGGSCIGEEGGGGGEHHPMEPQKVNLKWLQ